MFRFLQVQSFQYALIYIYINIDYKRNNFNFFLIAGVSHLYFVVYFFISKMVLLPLLGRYT